MKLEYIKSNHNWRSGPNHSAATVLIKILFYLEVMKILQTLSLKTYGPYLYTEK